MKSFAKELAQLQRMTVKQLKHKYVELFEEETRTNNKPWLIKRIIWRIQAMAEGDFSERARRRAAEIANDADLRIHPPKAMAIPNSKQTTEHVISAHSDSRLPPPGTILTRTYKGETISVHVLPKGFEYLGEVYSSLSAVAKVITGSHCNGFAFFKLNKKEKIQ